MFRKHAKSPGQRRRITEVYRKSARKKRLIRLVIGFAVILIILFFVTGNRGTYKLYYFSSQQRELQAEIDQLKEEIRSLEEVKNKLETDPAYIEKVAREKYKMKKKGERVFEVIEK